MTSSFISVDSALPGGNAPLSLPSVALESVASLPHAPGIYLVTDNAVVLYVGKSKDLNQRWRNHHRHSQVKRLASNPRVAFLLCGELQLTATENEAILKFNPALNGTPVEHQVGYTMKDQKESLSTEDYALLSVMTGIYKLPSHMQRIVMRQCARVHKEQKESECRDHIINLLRAIDGDIDLAKFACSFIMDCTEKTNDKLYGGSTDLLTSLLPGDISGNIGDNRTGKREDN